MRKLTGKKLQTKLLSYDANRGKHNPREMAEIRQGLAKIVNQRMRRLEKARSKITGESFNFGAIDYLYSFLAGKSRRRFSTALNPKDTNMKNMRAEINEMQTFLKSKSSSIAGMRDIERKRIETFNKKGIEFSNTREFYQFLNSGIFQDFQTAGFTSEQVIEIYDQMRDYESDEIIKEKLNDLLEQFRSGEKRANIKEIKKSTGVDLLHGRSEKSTNIFKRR